MFTHVNCTLPTIHLGPAGRRPAWAYDDDDDDDDSDGDDDESDGDDDDSDGDNDDDDDLAYTGLPSWSVGHLAIALSKKGPRGTSNVYTTCKATHCNLYSPGFVLQRRHGQLGSENLC